MGDDALCREVEIHLTEAFLARREAGDAEAAHIARCRRCDATRRELSRLAARLEAPVAELSPARAAAALADARQALADAPDADPARSPRPLPPGFARELARLLGFAVLPLPLLAVVYAGLVHVGGGLLGDLLPAYLASALDLALAVAAASWLGLVYGALPFVAHRRALRSAAAGALHPDEVIA